MSKKNKTIQQTSVKDTEVKDNKSTKQTQVNNPQKPKEEKKPEVEKEKNPTPPPVDPAVETVATEEIKPEPKEEIPSKITTTSENVWRWLCSLTRSSSATYSRYEIW